ncbi:sigma 54-interacting transcriptional regulator [Gallaecimonas sp. GXIMD4217]|uniref:sigma-54 dependent transcriptional regulator n=1 Tax=Gallaecimonas sp. GXIMD4217 TaxID=3131927 RepID=UPI00311ADE94
MSPSERLPALDFAGWSVDRVTDPGLAKEKLREQEYHVGLAHLSDLTDELQDEIEELFCNGQRTAWIALTHPEDLGNHDFCRLLYEYFYDYYTLPLPDNPTQLKATLGHAYGLAKLRKLGEVQLSHLDECQMVGASDAIRHIFRQIRKVANVDAPVLIRGESGTGKELIAKAIHQRSSRRHQPFVAVNCGALPDTLIHSELFGHEKGSFTGAHKRKIGRIEAAQGGTIFLDEMGDLPLDLQVNLLRFLQESTIERVGSNDSLPIDARVIVATNVDLEKAVEQGRFREDLYYRLNVLRIEVPRLADRNGDIELLARFFFQKFKLDSNVLAKGFSQRAIHAMNHYSWPGNVREMINRIRRALVMSENRLITPEDLGLKASDSRTVVPSLEESRNLAEKEAILGALSFCQNNISETARCLEVSRVTLYRLMDKYEIR